MLYLAWDREINISLFFYDVFVWEWGPRPRTSSRCYYGNKSATTFKKGIFVHPPEFLTACKIWRRVENFLFPKMFDSYRDLFLTCTSCHMASMWHHGTYLRKKSQQLFCFILTRVRALAQMLINFQNTEYWHLLHLNICVDIILI